MLERDGYHCRFVEEERCDERKELHVHHTVPLSEIWEAAGGTPAFVRLATDTELLLTVCPAHNNVLDARRREASR